MNVIRDIRDQIAAQVRVTRAQIVAAKAYLLTLGADVITIKSQTHEWARVAVPSVPRKLTPEDDDAQGQISLVAQYLSARLALGAAAWELVHTGLMFQVGPASGEQPSCEWNIGGQSGGINFQGLDFFYPEAIRRPQWHNTPSELFDADLYLQRLSPGTLHPNIEQALRLSLSCFRNELFVPCVAMLGAASEGAWIEMGETLARRFPSEPLASRLQATLGDAQVSTKGKVDRICHFYSQATCQTLYKSSGVDNRRLLSIQQWSDQVREARNVLHWGSAPSVPNTYEKVAILLMDAVNELTDLQRVRDAK